MRTRLLVLPFAVVGVVSACAMSTARDDAASIEACHAGSTCSVTGEMQLHQGQPAWVALVVAGDKCAKLALPDEFYIESKGWNGAAVEVTGGAFEQPDFDESTGMVMLSYTERDRQLSLGMCDGGIGIYVDTIRARDGRSWPSHPPDPRG